MNKILLTILSSLLLVLAFPPFNIFPLAWIGLVPFLLALENKSFKQSFLLGYCAGLVFYGAMIYWLVYVTAVGAGLFVVYLALYFALFALGVYFARHLPIILKAFFLSAYWILLEYIRNYLFTGFGWAALGHSQVFFLPVIQVADIFGMHSITFLIVFVNVAFKELFAYLKHKHVSVLSIRALLTMAAVMFCSMIAYGIVQLSSFNFDNYVNVGVVQPNIAQEAKWRSDLWPEIMDKYKRLTKDLNDTQHPDLIVWPETSYPGLLWDDIDLFQDLVIDVRTMDTPLLLGSAIVRQGAYYNSALLLNRKGGVAQVYDKLHLVPFGEFVPLRKVLPFLADIVPIGDFSAGHEYTVFKLGNTDVRFATLICFEDTVSHLARGFVRNGAQFLINITNDAWFMDSKAPFLHLSSAIFRSVENRRSLVRAANTGVSAFIEPSGAVISLIKQGGDATFVEGIASAEIPLNEKITFFNRYPQVFAYFCFACVVCGVIYRIRNQNINKQEQGA